MDFAYLPISNKDEVIRGGKKGQGICMTKKKSLKSTNISPSWLMEAQEPDVQIGENSKIEILCLKRLSFPLLFFFSPSLFSEETTSRESMTLSSALS